MKKSAWMVCKTFIDRCTPEAQTALIFLLPNEAQQKLQELGPSSEYNPDLIKREMLDDIHYSWLSPYLRTFSESDIRLFLSALTESQRKGAQKLLGLSNHMPHPFPLAAHYIKQTLLSFVTQNLDLTPRAFLPHSPYNRLLDIPQEGLTDLIRFLGLHDLSFEMRQIIATAKLKQIFAALSKREGDYLQTLLLHKEPLVFQRLFLDKWEGSREQLHQLIDERGVQRLGHALHAESDSLIWMVSHRLDIRNGTLLLKYKEKPAQPRADKILFDQISKILGRTA